MDSFTGIWVTGSLRQADTPSPVIEESNEWNVQKKSVSFYRIFYNSVVKKEYPSYPRWATLIKGQNTVKNQPSISASCSIGLTLYVPRIKWIYFYCNYWNAISVLPLQPKWRDPFNLIWVGSEQTITSLWSGTDPVLHILILRSAWTAYELDSVFVRLSVFGSVSVALLLWLISCSAIFTDWYWARAEVIQTSHWVCKSDSVAWKVG